MFQSTVLKMASAKEFVESPSMEVLKTVICPLQDMDNVQNAVTPLCYMNAQYPKYSKSIQTMYPVHSSKSSQQHK